MTRLSTAIAWATFVGLTTLAVSIVGWAIITAGTR